MNLQLCLGALLMVSGLTACIPGSPGIPSTSTPTATLRPSPTATITLVWFPPTITPTQPENQPLTPTPLAALSAGEIILQDNFTNHSQWETSQGADGAIAFGQNELTLAINTPGVSLTSLRQQPVLADFYLEITVSPSLCLGSDIMGVLFRAASTRDFYRLLISCSGQLRLERVKDRLGTVLQDWMRASPYLPGAPSTNRIGILAVKNAFQVFSNGALQFSQEDSALAEGRLGVYARSMGDNALTVSFSDLVVRQPLAGPTAATPTPPAPPRPSPTP
jgi:hypothetical protein